MKNTVENVMNYKSLSFQSARKRMNALTAFTITMIIKNKVISNRIPKKNTIEMN